MSKTKLAIFTRKEPANFINFKWEYKINKFEVRVMAISEGYAMVRRKGCIPFVCNIKDLTFIDCSKSEEVLNGS
jgi:hypothetical protein